MRNKNSYNTIYVLTYAELSKKGKNFVSSLVAILVPLTIRKSCCRCAFDIKTFEQCFSPKKLSKFAWFCSGFVPHNQEHPTSDHRDDKLKPKSVILTPFPGALLALWKCPLLVLPPYKPPQKAKKYSVLRCSVLKKVLFFAYCALNLCFCTCVSGLSCRCIFTTSNFSISSASKCSIKARWRGRPLIVNQLFQLTNSKLHNSVE